MRIQTTRLWTGLLAGPLLFSAGLASVAVADSPLTIRPTDGSPEGFGRVFSKQIDVFGLAVYATDKVPDEKPLHTAGVLAQYLDNDANGKPDNPLVIAALRKSKGIVFMFDSERAFERIDIHRHIPQRVWDEMMTIGLFAQETSPGGAARGEFDATLEEVLHLVTAGGYSSPKYRFPKRLPDGRYKPRTANSAKSRCLSSVVAVSSLAAVACAEEKTYENSIGMKMVRIEPGSFMMGSPAGGDFDERPVHKVTISRPFSVAATEVTNAQYEQFDPAHKKLRGKLGFSKEDDEAVVFVSWNDAVKFCQWLSKKEAKPYRLPTEAEWEYACRAGTTTAYHTGDTLPKEFHKNVRMSWFPSSRSGKGEVVPLHVGRTPPNPWGLTDLHGNVEEWCYDWYGPYGQADQTDPVGREDGDFRVTRGGSHSTTLEYLRSANRSGTLPEDKSWLIGFRVVQGEMPQSEPLGVVPPPLNARNVKQEVPPDLAKGPDPSKPYFKGPRQYVRVPPAKDCRVYNRHNHCPAIVNCPNGDLLAAWYTCAREPGRELGIVAARLPYGQDEWQVASDFWDAPDRNDHATALWVDEKGTIYHFNGLSTAATWGSLATILRTSTDNGATWSKARLIMPEHGLHHMPVESVIRTKEGAILVPCDAVTGGSGGTAVLVSRDDGKTWIDPAEGQPVPAFASGSTGTTIAGIHAGFVQLSDGRLIAFGRGDAIDGRMPMSVSADLAQSWTYLASPFPGIGGGQRLAILRLAEGPILFCSFGRNMMITDASGKQQKVSGAFAALSTDEGKTWSVKRLISDDGPSRTVDGGGNTGRFTISANSAEPKGYLSICQTPDRLIHLISSKQHYVFNLAWINTLAPPVKPGLMKAEFIFEKAPFKQCHASTIVQSKVYNHTTRGRGVLNVALSEDGKTWKPATVFNGSLTFCLSVASSCVTRGRHP